MYYTAVINLVVPKINEKNKYVIFLFLLLISNIAFSQTFYNTNNSNLPFDKVNCVSIDFSDTIFVWIGTENGLCYMNRKYEITEYNDSNLYQVSTIVTDKNNTKWFGTYNKGVISLNNNTKQYLFPDTAQVGRNYKINSIIVDKFNSKWIGTNGNGIWKLDQNNNLKQIFAPNIGFNVKKIIYENNNIYILTEIGIFLYKNNSFRIYKKGSFNDIYIHNNNLYYSEIDKENSTIFRDKRKLLYLENTIINSILTLNDTLYISTNSKVVKYIDKDSYLNVLDNFSANHIEIVNDSIMFILSIDNGLAIKRLSLIYYINNEGEKQVINAGSSINYQINFDPNEYILKKEAKSELNNFIVFYKLHPQIRIEIFGHTAKGKGKLKSYYYLKKLSKNRAKSVTNYLIQNGIPEKNIIKIKGYGSKYAKKYGKDNKRVEIKIIEIK